MSALIACLALFFSADGAPANLVRNGGFEETQRDGRPVAWRTSGDPRHVDQKLTLDAGREAGHCARLDCTRLEARTAACHAMLCQMGVGVKAWRPYRLAFWARAENIESEAVSIGLSDTATWQAAFSQMFAPGQQWARYEYVVRPSHDCGEKSRFQIHFSSRGTLWIDDLSLQEAGPDAYRPGLVIAPSGRPNLVPNASFECAADGWGSADWERSSHWGGGMNALFGRIDDREAWHGRHSLRIDLAPGKEPVGYFDYYKLYREKVLAPLSANIGFLEVQPGTRYTLSVWMKAAQERTPARLAVRMFAGGAAQQGVTLSTQWKRYSLSFTPSRRWCYVLAGPDLRPTKENPSPLDRATVWLDGVQLEQAKSPGDFSPREAVEFGLATDKPGNVFGWEEPVAVGLSLANADAAERRVRVELRLTDFFDRQVWRDALEVTVPARGRLERPIVLAPDAGRRGFLRLHARLVDGRPSDERTQRLAVIPRYEGKDSRFGVNHAYPWPHLLDLSRQAGLVWVRDWSLKWHDVEPEKGRFTFAEPDHQIDRPRRHGLEVLGLLPFPSSHWSSTSPKGFTASDRYPESRMRVAYAPRDVGEFESYVAQTVAHYKGRVGWFQVFNEPLYTSYSLPRNHGYDGGTYARYVKAFAAAARRANPNCRILGGIGGLNKGQILDDFELFFRSGGLAAVDAVDIHHYPAVRSPEYFGGLLARLGQMMEQHGPRKPIWLTEYGYYADDEPATRPMHVGEALLGPLASEQLQGEYAVRWAVLCLAGGVEKIFYHAGTCAAVNDDSLEGVFYEYAGQPHKIYAVQAVMSHLFTPSCRFVKRLELGRPTRAYLFRDGRRAIVVVWAAGAGKPAPVRFDPHKLQCWDLVGRPLKVELFVPSGTPLYLIGEDLGDADVPRAISDK